MANEIILFDLPSKAPCRAWSLNPWKARLALNYKSLPYRTKWVEYPDIRAKFEALGIAANPGVSPSGYSIPAARLGDGRYVMDSLKIAEAVEAAAPEPSLRLESGAVQPAQAAVLTAMKFLAPVALPRVAAELLNEPSQKYFLETRYRRWNMPLPKVAKSELAGEKAWEGARPGLEEIRALLTKDPDGPFVLGKDPSFADFVLVGFFHFLSRLDHDGDLFGRVMAFDDSFRKVYDACGQWLKRDDH